MLRLFLIGALAGLALALLALFTWRPPYAADPVVFLIVIPEVFGFTALAIWGDRAGRGR